MSMPAMVHLMPCVGVDVHISLVPVPPAPAPIPTPLPHPKIAVVLDPMDYAPYIGATVYIKNLPRCQAGTAGKSVPHVPMPIDMPPPLHELEAFMGSSTVSIDGDAATFMACPSLDCQTVGVISPIRLKPKKSFGLVLPTGLCTAIPTGVSIGGPPTISLSALAGAAGFAVAGKALKALKKTKVAKKLSDRAHGAAKKVMDKLGVNANSTLRNKVHNKVCSFTGHPVDVASGKLFTEHVDYEVPGALPLVWERKYYSTSTYDGPIGNGWHHNHDLRLHVYHDTVILQAEDGRHIVFDPVEMGEKSFVRQERMTLSLDAAGYAVSTADGFEYRFVGGATDKSLLVLDGRYDRSGNSIQYRYDDQDRLIEIIDSGGRAFEIEWDLAGLVHRVWGPHPEKDGERFALFTYEYDQDYRLTAVYDALGHAQRFAYDGNLIVKESDRNGLSFYFDYDGENEDARCIRTWGDGGIYDHKLSYHEVGEEQFTVVEDSLGYKTTYHHDGAVVHKMVDALGNVSTTEYDADYLVLRETNEEGQSTAYEYDERGNRVRITGPDGAVSEQQWGASDRLVAAVTPVGARWSWAYDERGRLVHQVNPVGAETRYAYSDGKLRSVTNAAEGKTNLAYDDHGACTEMIAPDGGKTRFVHDRLGRPIEMVDAIGGRLRRQLDLMGRPVRVEEPDGSVRELTYDAEGNVLSIRDRHRDVRFSYVGMGRVATRTENGTAVGFEYDREEQLVAIRNEHGSVYRFVLGPTGQVTEQRNFDGAVRSYHYDRAGRVVGTRDTHGKRTDHQYDAAGRMVEARYSEGSRETFAYRPDGELIAATNEAVRVEFERDGLGRVVKETQGKHWVASEYDGIGARVRVTSSLGCEQHIERNAMGDVDGIVYGGDEWSVRFKRDQLGLELQRELPGGVRSRWQRDKMGRPVAHEIASSGQRHRAVRYEWDHSDRLKELVDAARGATQYGHDPLGRLAWVRYPDGEAELRMPDAVGNLFRREDRSDRKYGASGQLLESIDGNGGVTRYEYDVDGNLAKKILPSGDEWRYAWSRAGMLERVDRPDGESVHFQYDALGRRVSKTFRGRTTHWVWDGNNPLHEWVTVDEAGAAPSRAIEESAGGQQSEERLALHPPTGPPTESAPITWLFDPETFAPMARIDAHGRQSIITDHLGTPLAMFDDRGSRTWSAELDTYGRVRKLEGERADCPFRFPGQYEDEETGLYYNRFRYYDPEAGQYTSHDPIGLRAGLNVHAYVDDPLTYVDPLGLAKKALWKLDDMELMTEIEDLVSRDKRGGGTSGGTHGLAHRFPEQVHGASGPGTTGWKTHQDSIIGQQKALRNRLVEANRRGMKYPKEIWDLANKGLPTTNQWHRNRRMGGCKAA